jgi:hypothetical protein
MLNADNILLRHNYISMPATGTEAVSGEVVATLLMNLAYYGRALDVEGYRKLTKASKGELVDWWMVVEKELREITGASRKIGDFVVYKNFPAETLSKTDADYWIPQILMYWGFPNEHFTEEVKARPKMKEKTTPVVLKVAKQDTLKDILTSYLKAPARWKREELAYVLFLSETLPVNLAKLAFKENLVSLATYLMESDRKVNLATATDVLRLMAGLSDGDVSLRTPTKFKSFKKPMRRLLLSTLEKCSNLKEDVARRPEMFKRVLHTLHPGDYKRAYPNVWKVNHALYMGQLETFNSRVETLLKEKDAQVLEVLAGRPGDFRRRLLHTVELFGNKAVKGFANEEVLGKLTTYQVVALRTYLETLNDRSHRVFPPKGNWSKVQIKEGRLVEEKHIAALSKALGKNLAKRLPKVGVLDEATGMVKLPNSGETGPYARGTEFPMPDNVDFIRSASYWEIKTGFNTWFDNGWNFFDANWTDKGSVCWDKPYFPHKGYFIEKNNGRAAATFSGDPTNTKDAQGRAAQLIDLYPERLLNHGIRYAVWNILCFSNIPFSEAGDVFAALQWGKDATSGKLFEPSRAQLTFPLTGEQHTKYVCVIDLVERKMIYVDANLKANVSSASHNGKTLSQVMPAFMEYIKSLPSVHDLFRESVSERSDIKVLYSDKNVTLDGESAYVFRPENQSNKYKPVDINNLLV